MGEKVVFVVSGLPRSGTSMMMKMLEAGGLAPLTDEIRSADEDNPGGYYEYERVKKMKEDASWLEKAEGRAVKVISQLLYYLPGEYRYKVIFMRRYIDEILASQRRMLERRNQDPDAIDEEEMRHAFLQHLQEVGNWLGRHKEQFDVLNISYKDVLKDPRGQSQKVKDFLGVELDLEKMAAVVDDSLYRQRLED